MPAAAYIGTGVVAFMRAGVCRTRIHTMSATVMSGYPDARSRDACRQLQALAARLIEADQPPAGSDLADRLRDDLVAGVRPDRTRPLRPTPGALWERSA